MERQRIKSIDINVGDKFEHYLKVITVKTIENKTNGDNEVQINSKIRILKDDFVTKLV
jgi:hypothetical protein